MEKTIRNLLTITFIALVSSGCYQSIEKKGSTMTNDQKIINAVVRSKNINKNITNGNGNINEALKSSMEILSGKSTLLDNVDEFGEFKPHVPKQGPMKDYFFINDPLHISISLNNEITNIERIKIATTTQKELKTKNLDFDSLNLKNYDIAKNKRLESTSTNKYTYLLNRLYSSKDYPNVIVSILIKTSDEKEYLNYNTASELPEYIPRIRISLKDQRSLRPFQTIGNI